MADHTQKASVRRQGYDTPGPRLGEIVAERMKVFDAEPDDAQWDAKKRGDGSWLVQLTFITGCRLHAGEWICDPRRRHVLPADDNAARMSLPGTEPLPTSPGLTPAAPAPGEATVTHLASRLSSASGFGPGGTGNAATGSSLGNGPGHGVGSGGHPRYERPAAARPAAPEPKVAEWEAPQPRENQPRENQPREPRPHEAQPREPEAPAAAAPPVPSAPPASPARVAAQVSRAAAHAAPSAGGNSATVAAAAAATPAVPVAPPAPPAEPAASAASAPPAQPEATGEQTARQGRKAARGRRSSVPSWDEIMFGSSRQRD